MKRFINNLREITQVKLNPTQQALGTANYVDAVCLLALSMFFASILLFVFLFYAHEHRFLSIMMPLVETTVCLFVFQKITLLRNEV
jgi:hypothetical protein